MASLAFDIFRQEFLDAVVSGLTRSGQKELPSQYLYDDLGSALFEAITALPEYGLTRADERLLCHHAVDIAARCRGCSLIAELGSGFGRKTRHVVEAVKPGEYIAIDVSSAALKRCRLELSRVTRVPVHTIERPYLEGLREALARRVDHRSVLVMFLGSTIGNFHPAAAEQFLTAVRRLMLPGDAFLLGADLIKQVPEMLAAYDDPTGVTAAFDLNLLGRINRELGGNFHLRAFAHEARWNADEKRIEMHLRSLVQQRVKIGGADCEISFEPGETIWTESCHKFTEQDLSSLAERTGFSTECDWVDEQWPFIETLWRVH
jgi:L-histidine Nalpha-methyltransferase